ncbi:ThuA domain-containing protein [Verrucomicrobiales bacterium]|nr:ThuA domain-containing protein [Verrucomicrobiales bacterium]MDF1789426.1 ThuA domain-containing protein [Verrucomicrobiales bacterium]
MKRSLALVLPLAIGAAAIGLTISQTIAVKEEAIAKIAAALPANAPAKPAKARKVLVFSKTAGFRHGSIGVGAVSLTEMGKKTGAFEVTHSEDESVFENDSLSEFDAVIMLNTTGEIFRPKDWPGDKTEQKKAQDREARLKGNLLAFVREGKGLAGMHSATDTYKKWKEYNDMMGGAFVSHPWHKKVPLKNLDPTSPVNAAFSTEGFEVTDEIYQFRDDTALRGDRRMLLELDADKMDLSKGSRGDRGYPVSWIDTYGRGRVFYCSLGHRDEIFWNPAVLKHYLAGIQYALGDLEADATPLTP